MDKIMKSSLDTSVDSRARKGEIGQVDESQADTSLSGQPAAKLPGQDDSAEVEFGGPRQVIEQAASDIGHGLLDTERRGIPSDVPGPGSDPQTSPGAEAPAEGVDRKNYAKWQKINTQKPGQTHQ